MRNFYVVHTVWEDYEVASSKCFLVPEDKLDDFLLDDSVIFDNPPRNVSIAECQHNFQYETDATYQKEFYKREREKAEIEHKKAYEDYEKEQKRLRDEKRRKQELEFYNF